jgi:hypothetical protein
MSRQEQIATQKSVLDKKGEEQKLSNPENFLKDFNSIYQKLIEVFPNIDSKTISETAASTNKYLVYQLIWTLKYLLEFTIIENQNGWLERSLPALRERITRIKINITAADPNLQIKLQEAVDKLFDDVENLLKKDKQNIALHFLENIFSIGGSAVRDISAMSRHTQARQHLEEKAGYIFDHNAAALLRAEDYQQYLQEMDFNRRNADLIIAHNRSVQLRYLQSGLKKDPENKYLRAEQNKFFEEQKKYDQKESKVREIMKDQAYSMLIKQRTIKLEKIHIREELNILAKEYLQISKSLYLENTEYSNKILLEINRLQKSLSKTLARDQEKIPLPLPKLKGNLQDIRDNIRSLKSLSQKSPFRKESESRLPTGAIATPLAIVIVAAELAKADFRKISAVKDIRQKFFDLHKSLRNSDRQLEYKIIAEHQRNYEGYIVKSAKFFLSQSPEKDIEFLFEIDIKKEFTASEVYKKFHELAIIFDPDKLSTDEAKSIGGKICARIEKTKQNLISRLYDIFDIQIGGPMKEILTVVLSRIEQTTKLLELSVSAETLPSLGKNDNNIFSQSQINERRSSVPDSASILTR